MTATDTTILVKPGAAWDKADRKFITQGQWVQCIAGADTNWQTWAAESYSARPHGGDSHIVTVDLSHPLETRMACTCPATTICTHLAGVARASGVFPYPIDYRCACGHTTDDPDAATVHRLLGQCRRPDPQVGAAVLLGTKAQRERMTT